MIERLQVFENLQNPNIRINGSDGSTFPNGAHLKVQFSLKYVRAFNLMDDLKIQIF